MATYDISRHFLDFITRSRAGVAVAPSTLGDAVSVMLASTPPAQLPSAARLVYRESTRLTAEMMRASGRGCTAAERVAGAVIGAALSALVGRGEGDEVRAATLALVAPSAPMVGEAAAARILKGSVQRWVAATLGAADGDAADATADAVHELGWVMQWPAEAMAAVADAAADAGVTEAAAFGDPAVLAWLARTPSLAATYIPAAARAVGAKAAGGGDLEAAASSLRAIGRMARWLAESAAAAPVSRAPVQAAPAADSGAGIAAAPPLPPMGVALPAVPAAGAGSDSSPAAVADVRVASVTSILRVVLVEVSAGAAEAVAAAAAAQDAVGVPPATAAAALQEASSPPAAAAAVLQVLLATPLLMAEAIEAAATGAGPAPAAVAETLLDSWSAVAAAFPALLQALPQAASTALWMHEQERAAAARKSGEGRVWAAYEAGCAAAVQACTVERLAQAGKRAGATPGGDGDAALAQCQAHCAWVAELERAAAHPSSGGGGGAFFGSVPGTLVLKAATDAAQALLQRRPFAFVAELPALLRALGMAEAAADSAGAAGASPSCLKLLSALLSQGVLLVGSMHDAVAQIAKSSCRLMLSQLRELEAHWQLARSAWAALDAAAVPVPGELPTLDEVRARIARAAEAEAMCARLLPLYRWLLELQMCERHPELEDALAAAGDALSIAAVAENAQRLLRVFLPPAATSAVSGQAALPLELRVLSFFVGSRCAAFQKEARKAAASGSSGGPGDGSGGQRLLAGVPAAVRALVTAFDMPPRGGASLQQQQQQLPEGRLVDLAAQDAVLATAAAGDAAARRRVVSAICDQFCIIREYFTSPDTRGDALALLLMDNPRGAPLDEAEASRALSNSAAHIEASVRMLGLWVDAPPALEALQACGVLPAADGRDESDADATRLAAALAALPNATTLRPADVPGILAALEGAALGLSASHLAFLSLSDRAQAALQLIQTSDDFQQQLAAAMKNGISGKQGEQLQGLGEAHAAVSASLPSLFTARPAVTFAQVARATLQALPSALAAALAADAVRSMLQHESDLRVLMDSGTVGVLGCASRVRSYMTAASFVCPAVSAAGEGAAGGVEDGGVALAVPTADALGRCRLVSARATAEEAASAVRIGAEVEDPDMRARLRAFADGYSAARECAATVAALRAAGHADFQVQVDLAPLASAQDVLKRRLTELREALADWLIATAAAEDAQPRLRLLTPAQRLDMLQSLRERSAIRVAAYLQNMLPDFAILGAVVVRAIVDAVAGEAVKWRARDCSAVGLSALVEAVGYAGAKAQPLLGTAAWQQQRLPLTAIQSRPRVLECHRLRSAGPAAAHAAITRVCGGLPLPAQLLHCEPTTTPAELLRFVSAAVALPTVVFVVCGADRLSPSARDAFVRRLAADGTEPGVDGTVVGGGLVVAFDSRVGQHAFAHFDVVAGGDDVSDCDMAAYDRRPPLIKLCVLIAGRRGDGKTTHAAALLEERVTEGAACLTVTVHESTVYSRKGAEDLLGPVESRPRRPVVSDETITWVKRQQSQKLSERARASKAKDAAAAIEAGAGLHLNFKAIGEMKVGVKTTSVSEAAAAQYARSNRFLHHLAAHGLWVDHAGLLTAVPARALQPDGPTLPGSDASTEASRPQRLYVTLELPELPFWSEGSAAVADELAKTAATITHADAEIAKHPLLAHVPVAKALCTERAHWVSVNTVPAIVDDHSLVAMQYCAM